MALVHEQSCECANSELDLFSVPPTQVSVIGGRWVEFRPIASITDTGAIEFAIPGSGDDYMDLANSYIYVTAKVLRGDLTPLAEGEPIAPTNLMLHSLFSQVDFSMNEKLVSSSNNTYPYRAYLETLLSYGNEAKSTQLTSSLWYSDTPGQMDAIAENAGLVKRAKFTAESKTLDLIGRLHLDMWMQSRYLLNGVSLKIRLVRNKPEFVLMTHKEDPNYKIVLEDVSLFVRKVSLNPSVQLGHIKALEKGTAKYPVRRVETKIFSIPEGNLTSTQETLFLGQVPERLIIGFVENAAFNGSYKLNPFNFKSFNVNFFALHVDGVQIPSTPLTPDFLHDKYIRSYFNLFSNTGQAYGDEGNGLNREAYKSGYCLFCFNLTPELSEGQHFNLVKQGNVRLELRFAEPLPSTINVICYAEFSNLIHVDRARNVLYDYST